MSVVGAAVGAVWGGDWWEYRHCWENTPPGWESYKHGSKERSGIDYGRLTDKAINGLKVKS